MDKNTKNEKTVGEKIGELAIKTGGYKEMNQDNKNIVFFITYSCDTTTSAILKFYKSGQ